MIALGLVAVVTMVLAVMSLVKTIPAAPIAKPVSGDDQIVVVGEDTMFLQEGSVGSKIVRWLEGGKTDANAFFVDEEAFAAGTDVLTPEAAARLDRLVKLMKAEGDLQARMFVTTYEGADAARKRELASSRSRRIRSEMVARGVHDARITTAVTEIRDRTPGGHGARPTIVIVLSRTERPG